MSTGTTVTAEEYIGHHLTNLTYGQKTDGSWGIAHSGQEAADMGFWAINLDTFGFSLLLGALFVLMFYRVAKTATSGKVSVGSCLHTRLPELAVGVVHRLICQVCHTEI